MTINFRESLLGDGLPIWEVVRATGVLDVNSAYCYHLLSHFFGNTTVVALDGDQVIGFVSGYGVPKDPSVAFLWQIGFLPAYQGQGLGRRLLDYWVALPALASVSHIHTTISPDNQPSQGLFCAWAKGHGLAMVRAPFLTASHFGDSGHPPEDLYVIEKPPIARRRRASKMA
jgi:L-2,4-diaminobutyric acid acetyltransferase